MANLTEKELSALEDQLNYEQVLIKKYNGYAAIAQDQQIRDVCTQLAARHKQHFDTLMGHLQ